MDTPTRITDFGSIDLEVSRVAHGGFGVVYMGPDGLANGAWRALKTLQRGGGQRVYDAFVREALIWRGLWPHSNLLPTYGVIHMHHHPYIILSYAEGGSLRAHLAHRHVFPLRLGWAQMIAAGLVALHTLDPELLRPWPIVHRDLKPENVLLNANRIARISDFGLARVLEFGQGDSGGGAPGAFLAWARVTGSSLLRSRRAFGGHGAFRRSVARWLALPPTWLPSNGGEVTRLERRQMFMRSESSFRNYSPGVIR